MTEHEVTFSTMRFHKSSRLKNQVRLEETLKPRKAGLRVCSVPWQVIVIALGILCSLRLVIIAVLVTKIFQYSQHKQEIHETINHNHNYTNMQSDINLKEEMLKNKSIDCSPGEELLESLNREQKRWYSETKTDLDSSQDTGIHKEPFFSVVGTGVKHWFCYGTKCFYFIMSTNTWSGCKHNCQNNRLALVKIEDEDELKFLQFQVVSDSYWIGLSYDKKKKQWAWIDNGPSKLDMKIRKMNFKSGGCVFLSKTRLEDTNCSNSYYCICGKKLDKFPH
ncbi:killer cell lectin-like receptor 5 isoform X1 [Mus caroli]|uniref:Killer cell lectin-like receptor 5 isoform X1 n=1 Tax=Mus caroli TaxID=10089 RepID=A0A6P5PD26_MUSCR|nr:killer cell lectin-like receptor 5 isoform X1 [Mus caroli]